MPAGRMILRGHIWLLASLIPLLVRLLPLKALLALLTPPVALHPYHNAPAEQVVELVKHRLRRPRNMRRRSCLRLSLTLYHFLRLAGDRPVLHIGVLPPSRDANSLHAHCWVTLGGVPVADAPVEPMPVLLTHGESEAE